MLLSILCLIPIVGGDGKGIVCKVRFIYIKIRGSHANAIQEHSLTEIQ
jgi:hypothetical protein